MHEQHFLHHNELISKATVATGRCSRRHLSPVTDSLSHKLAKSSVHAV
jgi:hypothetical protein